MNPTSHTSLWIDGIRSDQRTWETINSHDVGVDFAFLNNRLRGSFDYFIKRNNGMFINVEYPSILGLVHLKQIMVNLRLKVGK